MNPFRTIHVILAFLGITLAPLAAQDEAPLIPVGSLSAFPTIVQTGTHPELTWDITLPESVEEIIEIIPPGTISPKRDVVMDVRILGAGVTYYSGGRLYFVPTETRVSINGGNYDDIFYGTNYDVDPNDVVFSREMEEGETVNFGARYYHNNSWGSWYSSTNSSHNVVALINGDTPPTTTPMNQAPTIESFIRPYLSDDGKIVLGPRDVIYLFELTHTNRNDQGFDIQDMAVLVSFYEEVAEEEEEVNNDNNNNNGNGRGRRRR
ncbi:MAG: hypothetical protein P1U58_20055 [Verrucomicrobiales bacterium]|nr:hypothetical protein [Verrucomicrobiales bacterium]